MKRIVKNINTVQQDMTREAAATGFAAPGDFRLDDRRANAANPKLGAKKGILSSPEFLNDLNSTKQANKGNDAKPAQDGKAAVAAKLGVDDERQQSTINEQGKRVPNPAAKLDNESGFSSENTVLGGDMDSKAPQLPVELLEEH